MGHDPQHMVTRLLHEWKQGDSTALDALTPLIESELRRLAGAYMRNERQGHTLQPTALVNEAWMRIAAAKSTRLREPIALRRNRRPVHATDSGGARAAEKRGQAGFRGATDGAR
jgi:ECF sigma factor